MSLHPEPISEVPAETARVARVAFPKGTVVTRLRDEFSALYEDEDFRKLYPARGQPGLASWRLALVTVFQFLKHLSDRHAADAVRPHPGSLARLLRQRWGGLGGPRDHRPGGRYYPRPGADCGCAGSLDAPR